MSDSVTYAEKLRWLAEWLDSHPTYAAKLVSVWDYPSIYVYADDAIEFGTMVGDLGKCDKEGNNGNLTATKGVKIDGNNMYRVTVTVASVCEAKPTGEVRSRKFFIPKNARQDENGEWVIDEEVVEYDCPKSFLGLAQ